MRLGVFLLICLFAVGLTISPVLGETNSTDDLQQRFQEAIGRWLGFFDNNVGWVSATLLDFMRHAIKATYFTIGVLGFILWASGISKYSGRRLLLGALALAFVSEVLL